MYTCPPLPSLSPGCERQQLSPGNEQGVTPPPILSHTLTLHSHTCANREQVGGRPLPFHSRKGCDSAKGGSLPHSPTPQAHMHTHTHAHTHTRTHTHTHTHTQTTTYSPNNPPPPLNILLASGLGGGSHLPCYTGGHYGSRWPSSASTEQRRPITIGLKPNAADEGTAPRLHPYYNSCPGAWSLCCNTVRPVCNLGTVPLDHWLKLPCDLGTMPLAYWLSCNATWRPCSWSTSLTAVQPGSHTPGQQP